MSKSNCFCYIFSSWRCLCACVQLTTLVEEEEEGGGTPTSAGTEDVDSVSDMPVHHTDTHSESPSPALNVSTPAAPAKVTVSSRLKRKRAVAAEEQAIDKGLAEISEFFKGQKVERQAKAMEDDDSTVFGKFIAMELRKIECEDIKREFKNKIITDLFAAQAQDRQFKATAQSSQCQYFMVQNDGLLAPWYQ